MRALRALSVLAAAGALLGAVALFHARGTRSERESTPASQQTPQTESHRSAFTTTLPRPNLAEQRETPAKPALQTAAERLIETLETSQDASAIEAALRAVLTTYSSRSTLKASPDAKLDRALIKHLGSDSPVLFQTALEAARIPLMTDDGPSPELTRAISEFAQPGSPPARRKLALEALNLIRPSRRTEAVLQVFEQALAAREPEVVSEALWAFAESGAARGALSEERRARLAQRILELTRHENPGVRGRALRVFADVPGLIPNDARFQAGVRALDDRHGYVRGEAAHLLSRCQEPRAIHGLMSYVGDLNPAAYELPYGELDGQRAVVPHDVSGRKRVAEAALFAILSLSKRLTLSTPFPLLTLGGRSEPDAKVLENTALVRAWYRAAAREIPR